MSLQHLLHITQQLSGRWTIPILLSLKETGGRFTPLQHHLGISPSRLSSNLKRLEENGFVKHISPYERRHPLLPEYQLTEEGLLLREAALAIRKSEATLGRGPLAEKAWNLPVLLAVYHEYERFQEIRKLLDQSTPRILSMRIQELGDVGLIQRTFTEEPRPGYVYTVQSFARPPVGTMAKDLESILC